jgi:hypothetical protein
MPRTWVPMDNGDEEVIAECALAWDEVCPVLRAL